MIEELGGTMTRRAAILGCLAFFAAAGLRADFSYEQSSKMTGGMMAGVMKVAGVFSRTAREPIVSTVIVKGDRMAHINPESAQFIDLAAETITSVNFRNKTYSVMTFAQMAQVLEQMQKKAAAQSDGKADVQFKASVRETGQKKQITGFNTREVILTLVMQSTDEKSGAQGALTVTSDMWLAPDVPGYAEVRAFHQRMAQKLAWTPGSSAFTQGRGDMAKAFGDLSKEAAKMEGVPLLQVVSMGGQSTGQPGQPAAQPPAQKEEREAPSIGGALGRLGGLGGLGRRKKAEQPKDEQPAATASSSGGQGVLMEMTTEITNLSAGAVDATKFQVPAGFKQVENEMLKGLR
jgi:hypothetical protein